MEGITSYVDKLKKKIPELLDCKKTSAMFNSYFSIEFKKICCTEITHYPSKMMQCNGIEDDLLGITLPPSNRDGIFIATKQDSDVKYTVEGTHVHRDMDVFAHYPITCTFNGCKLLSWNVEGRCDTPYSRAFRTQRKNEMIQFMESQKPDVMCIQNFFLRKSMASFTSNSYKIQDELSAILKKKNKVIYLYFNEGTDVILVKPEFLEKKETRNYDDVKVTIVPRYNDTSKRTSLLYIKKLETYLPELKSPPFYVVNMHLKTPKSSTSTHEYEMAEILSQLNRMEHFGKVPAVLIGTFNRDDAEDVLSKARLRSYMRGGRFKPSKTRKVRRV